MAGQSSASSRTKGRPLRRNPGTSGCPSGWSRAQCQRHTETRRGNSGAVPRPHPTMGRAKRAPSALRRRTVGLSLRPTDQRAQPRSSAPAGKQQLSRDGPAATSPSPCSPLGPRTPRGSTSRGSSGPSGVSNRSRSGALCSEPLQLLGRPHSSNVPPDSDAPNKLWGITTPRRVPHSEALT